jgi:hypothetical protein
MIFLRFQASLDAITKLLLQFKNRVPLTGNSPQIQESAWKIIEEYFSVLTGCPSLQLSEIVCEVCHVPAITPPLVFGLMHLTIIRLQTNNQVKGSLRMSVVGLMRPRRKNARPKTNGAKQKPLRFTMAYF